MKTKKVSFIDGEAARQKGRSMAFTQRRSSFRQARRKPRGGFRVPRANTLASSYAPDRPVRPTPGSTTHEGVLPRGASHSRHRQVSGGTTAQEQGAL
jgi:hypothetical protein